MHVVMRHVCFLYLAATLFEICRNILFLLHFLKKTTVFIISERSNKSNNYKQLSAVLRYRPNLVAFSMSLSGESSSSSSESSSTRCPSEGDVLVEDKQPEFPEFFDSDALLAVAVRASI